MSQATIAARPAHEHGALLSRSGPQAAQPAHRDRRADRGAAARRQALHRRALFGERRARARRGPSREVVVSAGSINSARSCWSCRASASRSGCRRSASRCATRCPASARTCATTMRRARAGRSARRASPTTTPARGLGLVQQALRYALFGDGLLGIGGAPMRAFVRSREGLEAPDLLLGWVPMLTEPAPKGPKIAKPVGHDLLRPSDAAGEQGQHPHHLGRSATTPPAINFNFLSSPVDAELTVQRGPHRPLGHDRAGDGAAAGDRDGARPGAPDRRGDHRLGEGAAETTYHPVGTCKMGIDPMAVVDAQAARARHRGPARRRRLDHADAHLGQHQRAVDHDRRAGVGPDPERLIRRLDQGRRPRRETFSPRQAARREVLDANASLLQLARLHRDASVGSRGALA